VTDARLHPSLLGNAKVEGLTDPAFRLYVMSVVWCAAHESDGVVPLRQASALHPTADSRTASLLCDELVRRGLWHVLVSQDGDPDRVAVHDFLDYNTTAEALLDQRRGNAERQRRHREARRITRDVTRDVTSYDRQAGRQGGLSPNGLTDNPAAKEPTTAAAAVAANGDAPAADDSWKEPEPARTGSAR
jgi:hypothetical protein